MKVKNILKKLCGEKLSQFLSRNFNQDVAIQVIQERFNNNGKDIKYIKESQFGDLKKMINSVLTTPESVKKIPTITATELLNEHGYDLVRVKSQKHALEFKKFFRKDEGLCKFNSTNVYTSTHVYFMVKHGADKIKPENSPKRQDDYSTSVMSIKVSKDGRNVLQITSRYNHTVSGCDNTHNSNLNGIVDELAEAFNHEFGYRIERKNQSIEFDMFVEIDNTFVYYHHEIEGIKIGNNTLITDRIVNFSFDTYYTYDYFIINLQTKKIVWEEFFEIEEGFVKYFNDSVKQIKFVKNIDDIDDNDSDDICYIQK